MSEWLLGTGYVRLWERIHRAEEALILVAPIERVLAEAVADSLRLKGSEIDNRDDLLNHARSAIEILSGATHLLVALPPPASPLAAGPYTLAVEQFARETLREVRRAINEFRDECRLGLVRARNQLYGTVLTTCIVAYLLLALAVEVGAPPHTITAAAGFFLVGAVIGLFNRLYLDAAAQTAVEDYGLSVARLLHTPIFSGLAAIGGVLIIPMLSVLVNPNSATSGNTSTLNTIVAPALTDIFNITTRPFGLVIAAIFGLTPATLISRLQQEAEQYKTGLKSTEMPAAGAT